MAIVNPPNFPKKRLGSAEGQKPSGWPDVSSDVFKKRKCLFERSGASISLEAGDPLFWTFLGSCLLLGTTSPHGLVPTGTVRGLMGMMVVLWVPGDLLQTRCCPRFVLWVIFKDRLGIISWLLKQIQVSFFFCDQLM